MSSRINFDVDDETRVKIDDVMATTGISTKRRLFEVALDGLDRIQRLVHDGRVIVAVKPSQLDSFVRAAGEGVLIVEQPTVTIPRWLVQRPNDWRSTPSIKGSRVHVSDVLAILKADPDLTPDEIARDLMVPADAVSECLEYAGANRPLIEAEERETRLRAANRGDYAATAR